MNKLIKVATKSVLAAGALALGTCAVLAPRRKDDVLKIQWDELGRYRYAHRGFHDNEGPAPENSALAFWFARQAGYGSELDVHLTADKRLVVIHDSSTLRATGVEGTVERMTFDELRELRLFGSDQQIPEFDEVLEIYEQHDGEAAPPLVVEVKVYEGNWEELTEKVVAALDARNVRYCVESFDPRVLWWLRKWRPGIIRGQLSEDFFKHGDLVDTTPKLLAATHLLGNSFARPDFVAYRIEDLDNPSLRLATGPLKAPLVVWTVKTPEDLAACDARGAVSIFEGFDPSPTR